MPIERIGQRYRWVKMIQGARYRSPAVFLAKKEAETALARWVAEFQATGQPPSLTPTPLDSGPITTVFDVLEKRLAWLRSHGNARHLKDSESLFRLAMRAGDFWDQPAEYLTTVEVLAWAEEYREMVSAKAANRLLRYLSTAFNGPWESKRLPREYPVNPFLVPLFPEDHSPPYVPSDAHVQACIGQAPDGEKKLFLRMLAETAARQSELRTILVEDLELDRGLVVLFTRKKRGGHRRPRRVPVSPGLAHDLSRWLETCSGPMAFSGGSGDDPRSLRWAYGLQEKVCRQAEVRYFSLHGYRHWRACSWAREGLRLSQIKARLGHETLQVTEHYLRSLGVEVEDLGL
ncbi:MAG: site-specific integrase [Pseudomonadota bacterium]